MFGNNCVFSVERYFLLSSGDMQISDVRKSDQGKYRCVAINKLLGDKASANFTVKLVVNGK